MEDIAKKLECSYVKYIAPQFFLQKIDEQVDYKDDYI